MAAMAGSTPPDAWTDEQVAALQRRTLRVVVASQVLGGAGLAAGVTVGALLAEQMLDDDGLAGLPSALFTLGSALTAFLVGRLTQRRGRRIGLGLGFTAGALGAVGIVVAAATDVVPLLLPSLFVYGAGTATNLQARYAGTDLAPDTQRATAVSVALVSTTLGAVAGPNLVQPLGRLATTLGLPELTGPFLLAAVAYAGAGTVLVAALRPDPYLVALRLATERHATDDGPAPPVGTAAFVGAAVMTVTQLAMVATMTMTPVHMREHHHGLGAVGLVIGFHIAGMFLPSLVTGRLVDRYGRTAMVVAAGVTLFLAGVAGATVPAGSVAGLILALVLLGIGWNVGLISGTALVIDGTVAANRPRVQGTIDVLVALAGAGGGAASGFVKAQTDYATLALGAGALAVLLIPAVLWAERPAGGRRRTTPTTT
jgi:MFS family permease